ncbi:regulatory protein AfsR [Longispora fulva]|nr:regulatory protein AfsR [Longispora fulva]
MLAALLLRAGRPVPLAALIDAVWGEDPPANAVAAVRTQVFRLRQALEPDRGARQSQVLVSVGDGYAVHGDVDVADFEDLVRRAEESREPRAARDLYAAALDLWRGGALVDVPGPYADAQRARLTERRLTVLEARLDLDLALGRHAEATAELTVLLAEHPLRERFHGLAMLALYRSGRQAEALAVFDNLRGQLAEELGVDPMPELAALHRRILAADPELAPTPSVPATGPAQLPADVPDFTGRSGHVAALRGALTATGPSVPVAAVAGMAGVGKSALAVHVAHAVRAGFGDGQLYADLRGGSDPADQEQVLGGFLAALGAPVPEGLEARAAAYRTALAGRRVLVLLDDARDAAHVRPLLPGTAGCAVLVTSRRRLTDLAGAHVADLDVLDPDEARTLLARVAGADRVAAERAAAHDLVGACGYLPLAVRIVGARLAARPAWTVASMVERLSNERHRLDELRVGDLAVESVFQLGYRQLAPGQARAVRLLAVPDAPSLSTPAAAAVLDADRYAAEGMCESLVDLHLLQVTSAGRYHFHDLVRAFARRLAGEPDALARLVAFYHATLHNVIGASVPPGRVQQSAPPVGEGGLGFDSGAEGHRWTDAEADALFAVVRQAASGDEAVLTTATELLLSMRAVLDSAAHWRQFTQAAERLRDAGRRAGLPVVEGRARQIIGNRMYFRHRFAEAELELTAALVCARDCADTYTELDSLMNLASLTSQAGRTAEAVAFGEQALALLREHAAGSTREAQLLANMSRDLVRLGRGEEALLAVGDAVRFLGQVGSAGERAHALYQQGIVQRDLGRYTDAVASHQECLMVFRDMRQPLWVALTLARLAGSQVDAGDPAGAVDSARQAVGGARELAHDYSLGLALTALGRGLAGTGDPAGAGAAWREAEEVLTALGSPDAAEPRALRSAVGPTRS